MDQTDVSPKKLAKAILDMCPEREEYEYIACPPDLWGKKNQMENSTQTYKEMMGEILEKRIPMIKAPNARIEGWLKCREFLSIAPDGLPWLQIAPNCVNLVRTLPALVHDDKKPEDTDRPENS